MVIVVPKPGAIARPKHGEFIHQSLVSHRERVAFRSNNRQFVLQTRRITIATRTNQKLCGAENLDLILLLGNLGKEFVVLGAQDADIFPQYIKVTRRIGGCCLRILCNVIALNRSERNQARTFKFSLRNLIAVHKRVIGRPQITQKIVAIHGYDFSVNS
ncbi:MAG: hypothetical protein RL088_3471 [Verrucomicrobiota bacterium]